MTSQSKILDEIMFYILERAKCEENTDKYLEHVLDYCKKDYQKASQKKQWVEMSSTQDTLLIFVLSLDTSLSYSRLTSRT